MNFPITELAGLLNRHPRPVPEPQLRERFSAWGHFYQGHLQTEHGPAEENMRSVLELWDGQQIGDAAFEPDAVIIMMNPGAAHPLAGEGHAERALGEKVLVQTEPDRTQYQVMRVMLLCGWEYVRVLNLSDLREPNGAQFLDMLVQYQNDINHSVFSGERAAELAEVLGPAHVPVVCSWGVAGPLEPIAQLALAATAARTRFGITSGQPWQYYHPLPRNNDWQCAWVTGVAFEILAARYDQV